MKTPALRVAGLSQTYGGKRILEDIAFEVDEGELVALLGPSGCGKTSLLKSIAGLVPIESGSISVNGRPIEALPPQGRNIAMIFQQYALFPHLTVGENVGYGLKVRGVRPDERKRRVRELLAFLKLEELYDRSISTLSGGQQQRVAIGRALAVEPDLLLLDEPLSSLDERLRQEMRREIRRILKEARRTALYVTHDQEEAMEIADRVVVMRGGSIEQIALPADLYRNPASAYIAEFLGHENLFQVDIDAGRFNLFGRSVDLPGSARFRGRASVLIPAESVRLQRAGFVGETKLAASDRGAAQAEASVEFEGVVERIETFAATKKYRLRVASAPLLATDLNRGAEPFSVGDPVVAAIDTMSLRVLR